MRRVIPAILILLLCGTFAFAGGGKDKADTAGPALTGPQDPFGKYNPPITVVSSHRMDETRFEAGDTIDKNRWITKNKDDLGIDVKFAWTASRDQYDQKMTASIASGDLPDIFPVNAQQLDILAESGLIQDLTDIYEQYTSDLQRQMMNIDPLQVDIAKIGGRLMAMPYLASTTDTYVLFVREDWREKLKLPKPDTIENLIKLAEGFANGDPDGNGRKDTEGLLMTKDIFDRVGRIGRGSEFLVGYHAYPNGWLPDSSGQLVFGAIQPQMKTALAALTDLYKRGIIDPEFAITDFERGREKIISGRTGLFYGSFSMPLQFRDINKVNPQAKYVAYPIPSADSSPAKPMMNNPVTVFYVVRKGYAHPEALIKLLNLNYEQSYGKTADMSIGHSESGYSYWQHNITWTGFPNKNLTAHRIIKEALRTGDLSQFDAERKNYYDWIVKWQKGDRGDTLAFGYDQVFGPEGSTYAVIDQYEKNSLIVLNAFYGPPTPSMVTRESSLTALRDEIFTKIVMGSSPISAFDTFVQDWKRQGGDDITKEVNEWYKLHK